MAATTPILARQGRWQPRWSWLLVIPLILWTAISIYPFLWMISTSLKQTAEAAVSTSLWPADPLAGLQTYGNVLANLNFVQDTFNSLILAGGIVIMTWVFYGLAGYALAVLKFPGRDVIFIMFTLLLFVPGVTILIPLLILLSELHLSGTYWGVILPTVNGGAPIAIFLLRSYFRTLPADLRESAKMDGASELRIWAQIYMPLALPALTFLGIQGFLAAFQQWVLPLLTLTQSSMYNLPLGVYWLNNSQYIQWNITMTGAVISLIPILIIFLLLQRFYIQGLAAGALTGQ